MIEEGTAFGRRYGAMPGQGEDSLALWPELPGEEEERGMYYLAQSLLGEAGYEQYEISNFPGQSADAAITWATGQGRNT